MTPYNLLPIQVEELAFQKAEDDYRYLELSIDRRFLERGIDVGWELELLMDSLSTPEDKLLERLATAFVGYEKEQLKKKLKDSSYADLLAELEENINNGVCSGEQMQEGFTRMEKRYQEYKERRKNIDT